MISHTSERFRKLFAQLPGHVRKQAREAYKRFRGQANFSFCHVMNRGYDGNDIFLSKNTKKVKVQERSKSHEF